MLPDDAEYQENDWFIHFWAPDEHNTRGLTITSVLMVVVVMVLPPPLPSQPNKSLKHWCSQANEDDYQI